MKVNVSLLFYLKKLSNKSSGPVPIYLRLTIAGKRAEVSTGRACEPSRWNAAAGRVFGTKEAIKSLNRYLDNLQEQVYEAHRQLVEERVAITPENHKRKLTGKEERGRYLVEIFRNHNQKMAALVGQEFSSGTLERYTTSLKHTVDFLFRKFQISDIDIRKINHAFLTDFEFYLRSVRKCSNNTAVKYMKNLGKNIRICLANGWLVTNPFRNYKAKLKKVDRVFLSEQELQTMAAKEFATKRLQQVRDIFLFSCFTGLAYVDVQKLKPANLIQGIDGEQWIYKNRQKTDTVSRILLLPMALTIPGNPLMFK